MCFLRQMLPARHILLGSPFFSLFFASPKAALSAQHLPERRGNLQEKAWRTAAQHTHTVWLSSLLCSKGKDTRVQESYVLRGPGRSSPEGIPKEKPPPVLAVGARFPAGAQSKEFLFLLIVKQSKTHACGTPLPGWELGSQHGAGSAGSFASCAELTPSSAVISSPVDGWPASRDSCHHAHLAPSFLTAVL